MIALMITLWTVSMIWGLMAYWVIQHDPSEEGLKTNAYVIVWCGMIGAFSGTFLLTIGVFNFAVHLGF